jgi:hypothetical protein
MNKLRAGLTLIETVVGVTIIGISFYALIAVFINLAPRTALVESIDKKTYLAQEKIEECMARNWVDVTPESGSFSGVFYRYSYKVSVTNVATGDLNTAVGYTTPFKNVKVGVWGGSVDPLGTVEIISLVSTYEIKL